MKKILTAALMMIIVTPLNAEIKFLRGPLAEALQKADQQKKPVMIDFITDWCRWCDTLDARTYSDESVADFMNASVIPIKIDAEKGEGTDIAKKYGVAAYPTVLLITSKGEEIDRILGYAPPGAFLAAMQGYVKGENTIGQLTARVNANPTDASLRYMIAKKYADRNDMLSAGQHFKRLLELDPKNTLGHNEEAQFTVAVASLRSTKSGSPLETFINAYPQSPRHREALFTLIKFFSSEQDGENTKKYFLRYIEKWPTDASMMNNYAWGCAERRADLDYAAEMAKKAVELASNADEKASYLDTYATVKFAQGSIDEAVTLEQQAIDLLKNVPNASMTPNEESMAKFRAALKHSSPN